MVGFQKKKILLIESLGEKLKRIRVEKNLSLEHAAKKMQLNVKYLRLLENDDYDNLPAEVYSTNFLKKYAEFLHLNPNTVVALFQREKQIYFKTKKIKTDKPANFHQSILNLILKPAFLKYSIIFLILCLVLFYFGVNLSKIFAAPELIIKNPEQPNIITNQKAIEISGVTEKEVNLTINDKQILLNNNGSFSLWLDLQKGLNLIKITAKKKHGKANTAYRQIIVSETE